MEHFDTNFGHVLTIGNFHIGKTWVLLLMNNGGNNFER